MYLACGAGSSILLSVEGFQKLTNRYSSSRSGRAFRLIETVAKWYWQRLPVTTDFPFPRTRTALGHHNTVSGARGFRRLFGPLEEPLPFISELAPAGPLDPVRACLRLPAAFVRPFAVFYGKVLWHARLAAPRSPPSTSNCRWLSGVISAAGSRHTQTAGCLMLLWPSRRPAAPIRSSRSSTLRTCEACHFPRPVVVGMPATLSASASPICVATPAIWNLIMIGPSSAARASARAPIARRPIAIERLPFGGSWSRRALRRDDAGPFERELSPGSSVLRLAGQIANSTVPNSGNSCHIPQD